MRIGFRKIRQMWKVHVVLSRLVVPRWCLVSGDPKTFPKATIQTSNGTPTSRGQVLKPENSLLKYTVISLERLVCLVWEIKDIREKEGKQCLL